MRVLISGFVCGLIFIVNVCADPITADNQAQDLASPVAEPVATALPPANAALPQVISPQEGAIQQVNTMSQERPPSLVLPIAPIVENGVVLTAQELTNRLVALEAQVAQMKERIGLIEGNKTGSFFNEIQTQVDTLRKNLGRGIFAVLMSGIILVLLFLLILIIIPSRKKTEAARYPQGHDYDLMEGQGGIAAKLNLSRAYIEMGHESKAESMLYEVLSHGNDAEQEEAKNLLEKIKQKSGGACDR